ncbi:hypothetical protein CMV_023716 [Castanea mollissima]|uniref:DUF4283 domain-containing protein n=1 Tax=Castanea mollissima TaxID=60419 RepID=A0A8J4V6K7_9ROSI|nr:hypothetical protein CMV_023716 [Castanea mollissima]
MDEVTKKWGNLSLTEREEVEHDLQDTELVEGAAIVAKFFTKRRVNLEAVATTLKSAWRTDFSFEVRDLGENKAISLFEDETDMVRVLTKGTWSFDKYLVAVHKLGEEELIQNICFDKKLIRNWGNNATSTIPRQKKKHDHLGELNEDDLEGQENDGASPTSSKGTWRRLNREATNTVAMEGVSTEKGPKRKLLSPLGETDPNQLQDKRAKIDIDEVALGKVFKKILGLAEVAMQPR